MRNTFRAKRARRGAARLLVVAAAALAPLAAWAEPADEMKAMVEGNKPQLAYEFGSGHPDEFGKPAFDYYFGIAAIDAGHPGEGVLALERYVTQFPANANARAQLARGYFVLGDDARAREEFEQLQKTDPPAPVMAVIERYLTALKARESAYKTTRSAFVEAGLGYDSNANSGAGTANVTIPVFGLVTLLPAGVHVPTMYNSFTAGGQISYPFAPGWAVFGGGGVDAKLNWNPQARAFNLTTYAANGGVSYLKDSNLLRLTTGYSTLQLDGHNYVQTSSLNAEWVRSLGELQQISPAFQYAHLYYPTQNVRNSEITSAGLTYKKGFAHPWQPVLSLTGGYGEERVPQAANLARRISSFRVAGAFVPLPQWSVSAGLSYQESQYRAPEPLLLTTRHDRYSSADVQVAYQLTRALSIRGEVSFSANHSNVALYAYDRDLVAVKLRYDFQ